ncbi:MAG: energy transducer TonB [Crocinitomicaceae bacterium]|tara:strand:- start:22446 stop:23129 length:684 start_codon:yes stop_codon:yes gene_type:complete
MNNPNKPTRINFISNGLLFASAALLAAFSFSEKSIIEKELHKIHSTIIEYQTAVKKEAIIKPKKRKNKPKKENKKKTIDLKSKSSQQIKTTKNKSTTKNTITTGTQIIPFDSTVVYEVIDIIPDTVDFPDQDAMFKGGYVEMNRYIVHHLNLTNMEAYDSGEVLVHVEFVINKNGEISTIKTRGKYPKSIEREVFRMIKSMPKWMPGENEGRKVNSRVHLPIRIFLQ